METLEKFSSILSEIRKIYGDGPVPLHRPIFVGNEKEYLLDCVDSNFVSSVGKRVDEFENSIAEYTGAKFAIAVVNGTAALHVSLFLAGVESFDEVLTQALTFVGTCNPIKYLNANPVFIDVDLDTLGMSAKALKIFLDQNAHMVNGVAFNKKTGKRIAACLPVHTFGLPCRIEEICQICGKWGIPVVEDAAESLGSYVGEKHTGTFGLLGVISFNGNKIITTGGGGMIITDDEILAKRAKHITTTSKIPHAYRFIHDGVGFNYRLPNLNAALGCAQMEMIDNFISAKSVVANRYKNYFSSCGINFLTSRFNTKSNCWLNAIFLDSLGERDAFLDYANKHDVMCRPIWQLMTKLPMFEGCQQDELVNSRYLEDCVVNLPSSVPSNMEAI